LLAGVIAGYWVVKILPFWVVLLGLVDAEYVYRVVRRLKNSRNNEYNYQENQDNKDNQSKQLRGSSSMHLHPPATIIT